MVVAYIYVVPRMGEQMNAADASTVFKVNKKDSLLWFWLEHLGLCFGGLFTQIVLPAEHRPKKGPVWRRGAKGIVCFLCGTPFNLARCFIGVVTLV